jgi:molecular chaperone DnaK
MVSDAKEHTADDKRKREEVEARNRGDQLVYETEKNLKSMGEKLSPDDRGKIEAGIGRIKEALKGSDVGEIKAATEALTQVWSTAAQAMYQQASAGAAGAEQGGPAPGSGEDTGGKEDAVDADYEVVD